MRTKICFFNDQFLFYKIQIFQNGNSTIECCHISCKSHIEHNMVLWICHKMILNHIVQFFFSIIIIWVNEKNVRIVFQCSTVLFVGITNSSNIGSHNSNANIINIIMEFSKFQNGVSLTPTSAKIQNIVSFIHFFDFNNQITNVLIYFSFF